jgi:glycosyltransferase involved in cell wall biosynthesis
LRLVIVTSAHPVFDKRVFQRHALLVRKYGHDVHLVAPSESPISVHDGVTVHGFPRPRSKFQRLRQLPAIYRLAASLRGDLYHLHDPDLLGIGWYLRQNLGVPVVYDAHEDFSVQRSVLGLPSAMSWLISGAIGRAERFFARRLDAVVCPHRIRLSELRHSRKPGVFLPNYPPQDIFGPSTAPSLRDRSLIYSGLLSISRGAKLILDAAERMPDVKFVLLAKFMVPAEDEWFASELSRRQLENIEYVGFVPFAEMPRLLSRAGVGIMPWRATPQHIRGAQPSKLYEYMACSLPVLASDLPITREIVDANSCGRLHASDSIESFVTAAYSMLDDPAAAAAAGQRGRRAFETRFSYEAAGAELLEVYDALTRGVRDRAEAAGSEFRVARADAK